MPLSQALDDGPGIWDRLLDGSPSAAPFASWAWLRAWTTAAPPEELNSSYAVQLSSPDGTVCAVLPVGIRRISFRRRAVTALTWATGDLGCPDHLDVLALPEGDLLALIPTLLSLPWDVAILSNLAADAPNAARLAAAFAKSGCSVRRSALWPCPYVDLPATWESYLASLGRNRRQLLRRCERNLEGTHTVTVTDYAGDTLDAGWQHLVTLHERRWSGAGSFHDVALQRLHRSFIADMSSRGQLWLATLDLDGRPAAAWYGFNDRHTVYFYQSGRDPALDDLSVGTVLMAKMVRRAIERGLRRFDFLRGDEAYKAHWTSTRRETTELVVFRPSWRGRWLRGLDLAARARARLRRTA